MIRFGEERCSVDENNGGHESEIVMDKIKKYPDDGDIFTIPLYLPSYQKWRESFDEFIDYKKYKFYEEDIYAFGRIIELYSKNCYIMEIFCYVGKIPDNPKVIEQSGQMFKPVIAGGMFELGRWRVLFENPDYDKWKDSDYENISFLYGSDIWKGGKSVQHITHRQYTELCRAGDIPQPFINGAINIECDIRKILEEQGLELNYEKTVEERKPGYPLPRDPDKKLKESVLPFRWMSRDRIYSLTLEADVINGEYFAEIGALGNGYDWEKIAMAYIKENMPDIMPKLTFDCEADTFSVSSSAKMSLRKFAVKFHQFCMDAEAFKKLLKECIADSL